MNAKTCNNGSNWYMSVSFLAISMQQWNQAVMFCPNAHFGILGWFRVQVSESDCGLDIRQWMASGGLRLPSAFSAARVMERQSKIEKDISFCNGKMRAPASVVVVRRENRNQTRQRLELSSTASLIGPIGVVMSADLCQVRVSHSNLSGQSLINSTLYPMMHWGLWEHLSLGRALEPICLPKREKALILPMKTRNVRRKMDATSARTGSSGMLRREWQLGEEDEEEDGRGGGRGRR